MALLALPGEPMVQEEGPSLPAATTAMSPAATAVFTIWAVDWLSSKQPANPRLMLKTLMSYVFLLSITHWIPALMALVGPLPPLSRTRTPTRAAPGATPLNVPPLAAPGPAGGVLA